MKSPETEKAARESLYHVAVAYREGRSTENPAQGAEKGIVYGGGDCKTNGEATFPLRRNSR